MASLRLARQICALTDHADLRADQSFELLPLCTMHPTRPRFLGTRVVAFPGSGQRRWACRPDPTHTVHHHSSTSPHSRLIRDAFSINWFPKQPAQVTVFPSSAQKRVSRTCASASSEVWQNFMTISFAEGFLPAANQPTEFARHPQIVTNNEQENASC